MNFVVSTWNGQIHCAKTEQRNLNRLSQQISIEHLRIALTPEQAEKSLDELKILFASEIEQVKKLVETS